MTFLEQIGVTATDPATQAEQLRAAIANNPGVQAETDQIDAERRTAEQIAPRQNDFLRDMFPTVVHRALTHMDEDRDFEGPVPVLTVHAYGSMPKSVEHSRDGERAVTSTDPVTWCHSCNFGSRWMVPFWLAVGRHILQIDVCPDCAVDLIDAGARPQIPVLPDVVPEDWT